MLDDDVTEIDAHAKFDAALCRCRGVAGDHLPLHLDRTAYRVDDAGKLGEQSVAGVFDHSAPVLGDVWVDQFGEMSLQALVRALLIRANQARIAGDIGGQDRCEFTGRAHFSGNPALRYPSTYMSRISGGNVTA